MDFPLKQWRNQHESEEQASSSAKLSKLLLDPHQPQQQPHPSESPALSLFVPEPNRNKLSNLSAFPDSNTPPANPRLPYCRMESYFSLAQRQELELQALIYRYMLAGAAVPPELLQSIKKSLLHTPPYFLHHPLQLYSYFQPARYWGRGAMDPEPGRCRRTDGKKWRCSRDVVAGQKYCERHVHRGRNLSRKPVEVPRPTSSSTTTTTTTTTTTSTNFGVGGGNDAASGGIGGGSFNTTTALPTLAVAGVGNRTNFSLSGQSPSDDLLHLSHSSSDSITGSTGLLLGHENEAGNRSDGRILRHFFDDWPRSLSKSDNVRSNTSPISSSTHLSISMPENSSSDVSLKLSTGNGEEPGSRGSARDEPQLNWSAGWGTNQVASVGGPLAEALRSSTSNSSPTSVLHQLPRPTASETSCIST